METALLKLKSGIKPGVKPLTITNDFLILRYFFRDQLKVESLDRVQAAGFLVKAKVVDMAANDKLFIAGKQVYWNDLKITNTDFIHHIIAVYEYMLLNAAIEKAMYVSSSFITPKHAA